MEQRPLFEFPTWDGKLVLAGIFIIGYYSLVILMAWRPLPAVNAGLIRDSLLTLGPPIGLIFGALFRTTGAEERSAILRSADLQTAITASPSAPSGDQPPSGEMTDAVRAGSRSGAREGVREGLNEQPPLAADGLRRDWLDTPSGDNDPWPTR